MSTAVASTATPAPPGKTKAKMRYLKKKKEKRKANAQRTPKPKTETNTGEADIENEDETEVTPVEVEAVKVKESKEKRPKKKRKVAIEEDEGEGQPMDVDDEPSTIVVEPQDTLDEEPELVEAEAQEEAPEMDVDVEETPPIEVLQPLTQFPAPLPAPVSEPEPTLPSPSTRTIPPSLTSPLSSVDHVLHPTLLKKLEAQGIENLFAVQTVLIPYLLSSPAPSYFTSSELSDVCVSAPTGSGKTLSYLLPILHSLQTRIVPRLRALIILPTRDLVVQVKETFEKLTSTLTSTDVLITTPGRLVDQLHANPRLLRDLKWLVVDEADRLLGMSENYQNWIDVVVGCLDQPRDDLPLPSDVPESPRLQCRKLLFSATFKGSSEPHKLKALGLKDPQYFLVGEEETYSIPENLAENMVVTSTATKPLTFMRLLASLDLDGGDGEGVLVFTKSTESTERLVRLFEFYQAVSIKAQPNAKQMVMKSYSSDLSNSERKNVLEDFKKHKVKILVCSDLISRGLDISHVSHVISYDVPVEMRKYVHRVGRTARAGRKGTAWSLPEEQEVRWFKNMTREAGHWKKIKKTEMPTSANAEAEEKWYQEALEKLKTLYSRGQ